MPRFNIIVVAVDLLDEADLAVIGTSRHSPRRTFSGRYWGHSGQRSAPALNGSGANDPKRTLARYRQSV